MESRKRSNTMYFRRNKVLSVSRGLLAKLLILP